MSVMVCPSVCALRYEFWKVFVTTCLRVKMIVGIKKLNSRRLAVQDCQGDEVKGPKQR